PAPGGPVGVPAPVPLDLVVGARHNPAGLHRCPVDALARRPAARRPGHPHALAARPVGGELAEASEQLLAVGVAETRAVPDEGELAVVVVEAEEERADLAAVLVLPEAAHDHVDGPSMLDLDHRPLARHV